MSDTVKNIRDALKEIQSVPVDQAHTLPPVFFTSPAFLELEKEHIFRKQWICLGHESEIANPNDFFTTELVDEQLIVARGSDGKVRVLSNVCRHRANMVVEGTGNRKRFTCSYHAWSYSNEGNLIAAPLMEQVKGFKKEGCKLPEFASEIWQGYIFVNLDGEAEPLAPQLLEVSNYLKNYHLEQRTSVFQETLVWNANWKCLVENFMEGYHITPTHTHTLAVMNPTSLCEKLPSGEAFTAYRSGYNPKQSEMEPSHPDLTEQERTASQMFCIFPSFVMSVDPNTTSWLAIRPNGADALNVKWGVVAYDPENGNTGVTMEDNIAFMQSFNVEDKAKLETLQKGLKSRYIEKSYLAPVDFEGTVWDFYQYIARQLGSDADLD